MNWFKGLMLAVLGTAMLLLGGCGILSGQGKAPELTQEEHLIVYSSHPLEFIRPLVDRFESETGIKVEVIAAGTGELIEIIDEGEEEQPAADILWGGFLSTVKPRQDLFEKYLSANDAYMREEFKNKEGNLTRFTDIPSVLMVNTSMIGDIRVAGYGDLLNPALRGKIAMASPRKSSSAYEHLVNMLYAMGNGDPEAGWTYVERLCANLDGKLLNGSSEVYNRVASGEFAVGLTFEEGAIKSMASGAPVKLIYMREGVISNPDGIYVIKYAPHMENAKRFVDFVTSQEVQTMLSQQLYRRSVRTDVPAPMGLDDKANLNIIHDDDVVVMQNKKRWLSKFYEIYDYAK